MFDKWIMNIVIAFVLRQVAKFEENTDWEAIKDDLEPRVRLIIPGEWLDDTAVDVTNEVIDVIAGIMESTDELKDLIRYTATGDWVGAVATLKGLLLKVWQPSEEGKRFQQALAS